MKMYSYFNLYLIFGTVFCSGVVAHELNFLECLLEELLCFDLPHTCVCGDGLTKVGQKCYFFDPNLSAINDVAATYCSSKGWRLATILSQKENDDLNKFLEGQGVPAMTRIWTSGHRSPTVTTAWTWQSLANAPITYFHWDAGEPNDNGGGENCIQVHLKNNDLVWNDIDCADSFEFLCEAPCV